MQFSPSDVLRPYVKEYVLITIDKDLVNEVFYPSGYIELVINISDGNVMTIINDRPIAMPKVEVLGQLTLPTRLTVTKGTKVLVARIYPYASALFFPNPVSDFTNDSIDLIDVAANGSHDFYNRFMEAGTLEQKVQLLDRFLVQKLIGNDKAHKKIEMIAQLCSFVRAQGESFDMKDLSKKYGFTGRYIQKLFLNNVGLTPRTYFNMQRFSKSLELVRRMDLSLTAVAYDCGYYDQAHFIREFKKFTGLTPSEVRSLQVIS